MISFNETGLQSNLLQAIQDLGFTEPTPIQAKVIPHMLGTDSDVLGFAQTGTGKTAAFGLPVLQAVDSNSRITQSLILSPTRELCMQISKDMKAYAKYIPELNITAVYGGAPIDKQIRKLDKGAQIVVATPGRALDLIRRKKLRLSDIQTVVLDEADEMLSMGFKDDLEEILSQTPDNRQMALFSATMSKPVRRIAEKYMHSPIELSVSQANTAAENVQHLYYMVNADKRYEVLKRIADSNPDIYGIVFCRTRNETRDTAMRFMQDGYNADTLHGDLSQAQRDEVMKKFRNRHLQLLIATDVAARGLDVDDLTHVINYNLPDNPEVYLHRSGRTGRAGKNGQSVVIITPREKRIISDIERKYKISFEKALVPAGKDICGIQLYSLIDSIRNTYVNEEQIAPFLPGIFEKLESFNREELIKHFVSAEFNRFLDYYKNAGDINLSEKDHKKEKRGKKRHEFIRFHVNVGKNQKLKPARLIGMINEVTDSDKAEIGQIEILKSFSFFEVEEAYAEQVYNGLTGMNMAGRSMVLEVAESADSSKHKKRRHKTSDRRGSYARKKQSRKYKSKSRR